MDGEASTLPGIRIRGRSFMAMVLAPQTPFGDWIAALDAATGKLLWRKFTIPAPGEPGSETWPKDIPDAWKYGGGATWQNGSYDPELDLVY